MTRLYAALAIAALVGATAWWHGGQVDDLVRTSLDGQRAELQAQARTELLQAKVEAHEERARADVANFEMIYAIQKDRDRARSDAVHAAGVQRGLRDTIAALSRGENASADGAGARSLADAAPQLADALGECSGRYVEVAAVADQLTIQVIGLQRFIVEVVGPVLFADQVDGKE